MEGEKEGEKEKIKRDRGRQIQEEWGRKRMNRELTASPTVGPGAGAQLACLHASTRQGSYKTSTVPSTGAARLCNWIVGCGESHETFTILFTA